MRDIADQFDNLAKIMLEAAGAEVERPTDSASFSLEDADGFIPLDGVVDREEREKEKARKESEAEKLRGFIAGHEKKLNNPNFVDRAPPDVVQNVRETLASLRSQLESVEAIIKQLSGN